MTVTYLIRLGRFALLSPLYCTFGRLMREFIGRGASSWLVGQVCRTEGPCIVTSRQRVLPSGGRGKEGVGDNIGPSLRQHSRRITRVAPESHLPNLSIYRARPTARPWTRAGSAKLPTRHPPPTTAARPRRSNWWYVSPSSRGVSSLHSRARAVFADKRRDGIDVCWR